MGPRPGTGGAAPEVDLDAPRAAVLRALREDGVLPVASRVAPGQRPAQEVLASAVPRLDATLAAVDADCRQDAPGEAPPLDLPAARWAAATLHAVAEALAGLGPGAWAAPTRDPREVASTEARSARPDIAAPPARPGAPSRGRDGDGASTDGPAPTSAAAWSVDLALAALPDLARLARARPDAAAPDGLLARLAALARAWPLSGIGWPRAGTKGPAVDPGAPAPAALAAVTASPALVALAADRVLARDDPAWLDRAPAVAAAVRAALGAALRPGPAVARALAPAAPAREAGGADGPPACWASARGGAA